MDKHTDGLPHGVVMPPLAYGVLLVATALVHVFVSIRVLPAGSVQFAVGLPVIALSLAIFVWAFAALRSVGEHPEPGRPTETITTTGPYAFSRNPIYVGFTLLAAGIGLSVNSAWMIAGVPLSLGVVWWGTVLREERYLQSKFGESYLAYKRRVPRWLLVF